MIKISTSICCRDLKPFTDALSRPLGVSERFYWVYDLLSCTNFCVIVETDATISMEALRSALGRALADHPILRTKVVIGPGSRLAFATENTKEVVDRLDVDEFSDLTIDGQVLHEINTPFAPGSFPLMRCRVCRKLAEGRSTIIFTFHHAVTDAPGALVLVRTLLGPLFSATPDFLTHDPLELKNAQETLYPARFRGFRKGLTLSRLLASNLLHSLSTGRTKRLPGPEKPAECRCLDILRFGLDQDQTRAMVLACKRESTTVHGFLCAVLLKSLRENFDDGKTADDKSIPLTVISSVNMRRFLAKDFFSGDAPGMFISMVPTVHGVATRINSWDLARDIRKRLTQQLDLGVAHLLWQMMPPPWWLTPDMVGARRILRLLSVGPKGPIVTNLGAITPPRTDGESRITALSFAIGPGANTPFCVAADTWAGQLFVNCTFDQSVIHRDRMELLLGRTKDLLSP